ncbi:hypothetical protein MBLNU457_g1107t1 [Dothideomycetes sp. NU457]
MAPIRVALVGLSASAKTSWASRAHLPYLISSRGKQHYEVVALLNSSEEAAKRAREHFELPSSVRTYGDPRSLAEDENVDLVVCTTRVDVHYDSIEPSIRAEKGIFCEWPLAENYARASAVTDDKLFENSIIGLQGRVVPLTQTLQEVLASGKIGKVLSSTVQTYANLSRRNGFSEGLAYFGDRKVGGNPITIAYGHMIDLVHTVLGEWASFESRMQIQRPEMTIVNQNESPVRSITSDVPDFLSIHGRLARGRCDIADDASLAVVHRSGPPFKGTPAFVWNIYGEKGEILVTSPDGPYVQAISHTGRLTIQLHDHETDEVSEIPWHWQSWQEEFEVWSRGIAELYERYARWIEAGKPSVVGGDAQWPRLQDAVFRHKELDDLFAQFDIQH